MIIRLVLKDKPGNVQLSSLYPSFVEEMKLTDTTVYRGGDKVGTVFYNGERFNGLGDVQDVLCILNNN